MNEELVRANLIEMKEHLCEYMPTCGNCPMNYKTHDCDDDYVNGLSLEDLSERISAMVAKACDGRNGLSCAKI